MEASSGGALFDESNVQILGYDGIEIAIKAAGARDERAAQGMSENCAVEEFGFRALITELASPMTVGRICRMRLLA